MILLKFCFNNLNKVRNLVNTNVLTSCLHGRISNANFTYHTIYTFKHESYIHTNIGRICAYLHLTTILYNRFLLKGEKTSPDLFHDLKLIH